ncbi:MAG: hypothetical protein JKY71_06925 [Alphaproteobacteria bacterium]|nr:hypothetical protein [Alphaproteobacteria bacterium]
MGSLASRPKVPTSVANVQPVYIQQAATPTTSPTPNETPSAEEQAAADAKTASEARSTSLLGRDRSRFGSILTGFRGLLGTTENAQRRNTLLGE